MSAKTKKCSRCGNQLPLAHFYKRQNVKDGRKARCKLCADEALQHYRQANKSRVSAINRKHYSRNADALKQKAREHRSKNAVEIKKYRKRLYDENRAAFLCKGAKDRALRKKLPYALDVADIHKRIVAGRCELTGLTFDISGPKLSPLAPSLDRRNPALGYTQENIRVICYAMNVALHQWGDTVLLRVVAAWQKKLGVFA